MQLGNRIFPYPVLNQTKELSEYNKDTNFELSLQLDQNGNIIKTFILKPAPTVKYFLLPLL